MICIYLFQGQRQRKLEARRIREEKEEEERKQIDLEEAKFQAAQRKEAIEKAKTQQYYQTDRVKNFHVRQIFDRFFVTIFAFIGIKSNFIYCPAS